MAISRILVLLAMAAVTLVAFCEAQVNFTPNWGKRGGLQDGPCKISTDALMYIYKFIQYFNISRYGYLVEKTALTVLEGTGTLTAFHPPLLHLPMTLDSEAQKLVDCEKFGGN